MSILRAVGWQISKWLTALATTCAKIYDLAFSFVDFSAFQPVQDFVNSFQPVIAAIIAVSLFAVGVMLIFQHDRKPKIAINICLAVLVISSTTYVLQLMNNVLLAGKDAIVGSNSTTPIYDTVASNVYDLIYIDEQVGLANLTGNKADYPAYDTITPKELAAIDPAEVINFNTNRMATEEANVILKYKLVYNHGKDYGLEEVYNGFGWNSADDNDWFNGFYYRYSIDWWPMYLSLISLCLVYLLMGYKVFRILFEVGVYRIIALVMSANLSNSQKALQILDAIKNSYIVLLITCVLLKFYSLGAKFINQSAIINNGFVKGIFLIFLAMAVIDGPNLIQHLFGIDAGLSSGMGRMAVGYHMASNAGSGAASLISKTIQKTGNMIKGAAGKNSPAGSERMGSDKSNLNGLNHGGTTGSPNLRGSGGNSLGSPGNGPDGTPGGLAGARQTSTGNAAAYVGAGVDAGTLGNENASGMQGASGSKKNDLSGATGYGNAESVQGTDENSSIQNQETGSDLSRETEENEKTFGSSGAPDESELEGNSNPLEGLDAYGQTGLYNELPLQDEAGLQETRKGPSQFGGRLFKELFAARQESYPTQDYTGQMPEAEHGISGSSWLMEEYQREQEQKNTLQDPGTVPDKKNNRATVKMKCFWKEA
ncbi:hypothetical protein H9Q79_15615 [Wansuia hejianensis]|uniref:DUF8208 domain-containing protein n=2 Tax=Wansuia hejianensis TaxID=2763667 RepID=A0A7G9GBV9_9FIRM|nr:hypothetical protein [Wansuia hejianensis]QNM08291.1 hypothetical protein H9Q79_15615 [Wansuia hejianensis]